MGYRMQSEKHGIKNMEHRGHRIETRLQSVEYRGYGTEKKNAERPMTLTPLETEAEIYSAPLWG